MPHERLPSTYRVPVKCHLKVDEGNVSHARRELEQPHRPSGKELRRTVTQAERVVQREKEAPEGRVCQALFRDSHMFTKHRARLCWEVGVRGARAQPWSPAGRGPPLSLGHSCRPAEAHACAHAHACIQSDWCCCWRKWEEKRPSRHQPCPLRPQKTTLPGRIREQSSNTGQGQRESQDRVIGVRGP